MSVEVATERQPGAGGIRRLVLEPAEAAEIADQAEKMLSRFRGTSLEDNLGHIRAAAEDLPPRLRKFLVESRLMESDVFLVSGLPLSTDLPPTPIGWRAAEEAGTGSREMLVLLLCGSLAGDPFSWVTQQDGRIVHDVCPSPRAAHSLTSASSLSDLSLHTEDVHHSCRADYVSLMCLRNPDATATTVSHVDDVQLSPRIRKLLGETRFRFHPDDSHAENEGLPPDTGAVLFGPPNRPYVRFDVDFMSASDDAAADAIRVAGEAFEAAAQQLVLRPGDIVFLDNYRVVHGRQAFAPRYDGNDRWLKRINLARDIRRTYRETGRLSRALR
ncbi:TauD/TfdA family dioxygenase [Amycolatopsis sp. EV170708-02-1]|uniref:TauD/TfdA family dioxygenase n=1 Tax=Amycolatopsis sp. EV170708-02-1 TaxID=2919322 RepID=UPI001F0C738B|nr:TauD/TfdA family dioxygenase [Amycolatopsis sp. EV170708-02-1]UMP06690.1 TauD/TfdA family dioxygenase [Amycolatopsis sp. EV170708-02-1]